MNRLSNGQFHPLGHNPNFFFTTVLPCLLSLSSHLYDAQDFFNAKGNRNRLPFEYHQFISSEIDTVAESERMRNPTAMSIAS
jgi:hypothetical protein